MSTDDDTVTTLLSCNKAIEEWGKFGLEGLVILALVGIIIFILWLQKYERETWVETALCITETLNKAKVINSANHDIEDGK